MVRVKLVQLVRVSEEVIQSGEYKFLFDKIDTIYHLLYDYAVNYIHSCKCVQSAKQISFSALRVLETRIFPCMRLVI